MAPPGAAPELLLTGAGGVALGETAGTDPGVVEVAPGLALLPLLLASGIAVEPLPDTPPAELFNPPEVAAPLAPGAAMPEEPVPLLSEALLLPLPVCALSAPLLDLACFLA